MNEDWMFFSDDTGEDWGDDLLPDGVFLTDPEKKLWSDPKSNPVADIKRHAESMRSASSNSAVPGSISYTYTINGSGKLVSVASTGTGIRTSRTYTRWVDKTAG